MPALAVAAALLLSACSSEPVYQRPQLNAPVPAAWQAPAPFHAATPGDAALKGDWWTLYGDAQLNTLAQQALAQNQSLQAALSRLEQARAQVTVSSAGLLPALGLQAGAARNKTSADRPLAAYGTTVQSVTQNNYQLGLAVSYEADLFGRVRSTSHAAQTTAEQAAADLENTKLVLLAQLATYYFNLRERDAEIDVVKQSIALQQKAMDFISARHELGVASGLDLAQQQALLDTSKTQLELLENQRVQFVHALATMTGTPAPAFTLAPAIVSLMPPPVPSGVPSDLLQRRPDIASAERAVAAANANIGIARAAYFPTVMLNASGGWDSNAMGNLLSAPSLLWSLGVAATQTLFDAGKTDATVKIAQAGYSGAVANYRQSVLVAMQEVEDGMSGITLLGSAGKQADAAVRSSQRALELANDRYAGGVATYLDVITAQQTLLSNQRTAVGIHGQQMVTSVFLVKALGGGWQPGVAAPRL